jgi:hypothetical protein
LHSIAAYRNPEKTGSFGFTHGLDNKIRLIQRRTHELCDEEYPPLKTLTRMLPVIWDDRQSPARPYENSEYIEWFYNRTRRHSTLG